MVLVFLLFTYLLLGSISTLFVIALFLAEVERIPISHPLASFVCIPLEATPDVSRLDYRSSTGVKNDPLLPPKNTITKRIAFTKNPRCFQTFSIFPLRRVVSLRVGGTDTGPGGGGSDLNHGTTNGHHHGHRGNSFRGGGGQVCQSVPAQAVPSTSLGHVSIHKNGPSLMAQAIVANSGDESEEDGEEGVSPEYVPVDASEDGDEDAAGADGNDVDM